MISRSIYTGFDFLSDIGGLEGLLVQILAVVVGWYNYNLFDNMMVSRLYRMKQKDLDPNDPKNQDKYT